MDLLMFLRAFPRATAITIHYLISTTAIALNRGLGASQVGACHWLQTIRVDKLQ
jgi:hypothetical protein